ncbi:LptF/LptG family permease [Opitutus sp. GAS368]|jgi:lipopolysaccharide export system permease protein|uniref:LptF/LptG family permease n=1 Tax=Opitutus sp. GAS368 TaxID=1882749 RepID=UPI00087D46FD|nr:LptF/LptG family permease [Opitutus sp. GAS368]SDR69156.1 lipopolysaccharide export system permease protein [Opitutus sp. GAS368]
MNLIHRHIFANVVLTCAAAVGLFTFVLMLGNAVNDLMPHIIAGQLGLETMVYLFALMVPVMFSYALPMGMLTGVLLVLGRMSSDREITALRASGVSVAWLSAPILFSALLGVGATLAINFEFMPRAKVAYETLLAQAVGQNPLSFIIPKTFIRDFPDRIVYVGDKQGDLLKDIWIWNLDKQKRVINSGRATTGWIRFDEANSKLVLSLDYLQAETHDRQDPEDPAKVRSGGATDHATFDLSLGKLTGRPTVNVKAKWLTFSQLIGEWRRLKQPDPTVPGDQRVKQLMRVQVTIHEKFAAAFSVLSFALIAIPLGIRVSRKETSANLGLALTLAMAYYFGTIMVGWVDGHPALRPDLLMWLPNLGFQALGFWMFYKVDRS